MTLQEYPEYASGYFFFLEHMEDTITKKFPTSFNEPMERIHFLKSIAMSLFFMVGISSTIFAQKGTVRGVAIDEATGEPMYGVTVVIAGTTIGSISDFDGKFEIQAEPGIYDIQASFISFVTITITGVEIKEGEVTVLDEIQMAEDVQQLEEVVVTAEVIRNSIEGIQTMKRRSANVMDGISSASIRKTGDSDAASAMKRITGVSVEGGKYVFVRGLGDRYTKTTLNGMDVPGLDPDRNTIQLDIFPTSVIDNIMVSKSFTSDLPADFTGGIVNIETQSFPLDKTMKVYAGLGYNPTMHFNNQYLSYEGGSTDFLAFDDGTRKIPTDRSTDIPQYPDALIDMGSPGSPGGPDYQEYQEHLRGFNKTMGPDRTTSFMDFGFGFSLGNQKTKENGTVLGYNVGLTYRNKTQFFQDAEFNLWAKDQTNNEVYELQPLNLSKGDLGINDVLWGTLLGVSRKKDLSKYRINLLHLQNGESKSGIFDFSSTDLGTNFTADQYNLEYGQRSLSNLLIQGVHHSEDLRWTYDWKISPTVSTIYDPDIRFLRFRTDVPNYPIGTEVGLPERIWRYLFEYNISGAFDITRNHMLLDKEAKLLFGVRGTYKDRDFEIQNFQFSPGDTRFNGDPNELLLDSNLYTNSNVNGVRHNPAFIPNNPNQFQSNITNFGLYVSEEFYLSSRLKTILGVRGEYYAQYYTGQNQTGTIVLDNDLVLENFDLFPSLNMIYAITPKQNLRFSYSRTTARPSFKELSYAEILDPISGRTFVGGLFEDVDPTNGSVLWNGNLQSSYINNLDLRWEAYWKRGQTLAFSVFYKTFTTPIEMVQFVQDPNSFQPRNVGDATVIGAEVELRQSFEPLTSSLRNLFLVGNVTINQSQIQMSESEYRSRLLSARAGEEVKSTRPMAGQAPYLVNVGLAYESLKGNFETGIFYNVQGETLVFVGFANRTDVYAVPFNSLNYTASYKFGPENRYEVSFKITNILDDLREQVHKNYGAQDQIFSRLRPATEIAMRFAYNIF